MAALLADAADALEAAHQQQIVHCDTKPSNLLLDAQGKLWLIDFGLASLGVDQTISTDQTMRFWDVASGRDLGVLALRESEVHSLAYDSATEQLLTGGPDGPTRVWPTRPRRSPAAGSGPHQLPSGR